MTTVIVPVDFSETSLHAAKYATQLLVGHYGVTLILYHSYSKASEETKVAESLEDLKKSLMNEHIVKMETHSRPLTPDSPATRGPFAPAF